MGTSQHWLDVTPLAVHSPAAFDVSYARHIEPMRILRSTPRRLRARVGAIVLPPSTEDAVALSRRKLLLLGRVAEAELLFAFRLRQAASGQHRAADTLNSDGWPVSPMFADADEAVALFSRLRRWNLRFIRSASPKADVRPITLTHSNAVRAIVGAMAHHDIARLDDVASLR